MPPGFLVFQLLTLTVPLGALGFFGWLGLRFVRAREREAAGRIDVAAPQEVAQLREAVNALQSEVHALQERQDFMERLLERPRPSPRDG
jgi:hypothetical protein